jgi:lipoprotein-anchoring transpeptidase ErfK/SrfK
MVLRGAAIAALLIGAWGSSGEALAQYYPLQRAYPAPYRPLPPLADADDDDDLPPAVYGRPLPPDVRSPVAQYRRPIPPAEIDANAGSAVPPGSPAPPGPPYGHRIGADDDEPYVPAPPPGYIYREPQDQRGYEPVEPGARAGRPYPPAAVEPQPPYIQPPPAAGAPPPPPVEPQEVRRPPPPAEQQDALRPPAPVGQGQQPNPQDVTGNVRGDPRALMSSLPPDYRPESGPKKELPPQFRRTLVDFRSKEPVGTIVIDTPATYLYLVLGNGKAMRYGVGVGREGFTWSGVERVSKMAEWPDWYPPDEMIERQPYLPRFMAGGEGNPLGARALYLGKTVYRIHGTNQPSTIGSFVSSGCIRLTNEDVMDLYGRVKVGTRVVVLPGGKPPAQASAVPVAPQGAQPPAGAPGRQASPGLPPPPFVR